MKAFCHLDALMNKIFLPPLVFLSLLVNYQIFIVSFQTSSGDRRAYLMMSDIPTHNLNETHESNDSPSHITIGYTVYDNSERRLKLNRIIDQLRANIDDYTEY